MYLSRSMQNPTNTNYATAIDRLTYTYDTGNKLLKVEDAYKNSTYCSEGFKEGTNTDADYSYDANGNMIVDQNKGITAITYNHLNLPIKITFGTTGYIGNLYSATGQKVQKMVSTTGASAVTTDYIGCYQYLGGVLQFFPTAEGYVDCSSGNYNYIYQYKDHLGN